MRKILLVMAHPDDESFGPGSTVAKYASEGVEIQLVCGTKGEGGMWSDVTPNGRQLGDVREQEHAAAAKILGIKQIDYLGYIDGHLANKDMAELTEKVGEKAREFKPDILLAFDPFGISGHIDHITMTMVATKVFDKEESIKKLYYFTVSQAQAEENWKKYGHKNWVKKDEEITTFIDVAKYLLVKMAAAKCNLTQMRDIERLTPLWEKYGKVDRFILGGSRVKTKFPESDLFEGIIY